MCSELTCYVGSELTLRNRTTELTFEKLYQAPEEMCIAVKSALVDSEIIVEGQLDGAEWEQAYMALKGVWASK